MTIFNKAKQIKFTISTDQGNLSREDIKRRTNRAYQLILPGLEKYFSKEEVKKHGGGIFVETGKENLEISNGKAIKTLEERRSK